MEPPVPPQADVTRTNENELRRRRAAARWAALAAIFIVSSAWCVTAARTLGATFDEPLYLRTGLSFWHGGDGNDVLLWRGTMPLPADVDGLFVRVEEAVRGRPFDPQNDMRRMLPAARAGNLVFWLILLVYAWKLGELAAGAVEGGLMAAAMVAVEPILLGHASLATTDIAVSALVVAATYYFAIGRNSGWIYRVGIPSLCCGLAILSKASGLAFTALCMFAVEAQRLGPRVHEPGVRRRSIADWFAAWAGRLRPFWRDLRQIIGIGLLITILYCGSGWHPQWSFVAWARTLPPDSTSSTVMLWLAEHLRIFNNAISALVYQFKHNMHGPSAYLLGRVQSSFWCYYPLTLLIKLSIPVFVLGLTLACVRPGALRNCAAAAALALLLFSIFMRLQIGIRLVLPLVALLIIAIAAGLAKAIRESGRGWNRRLLAAEFLIAIVWTGAAALHVWPNAICYTNALWGGTQRGYLYLSDSNYDWGQGVPELERWRQSRGVKRMGVLYFGMDPAVKNPAFFIVPPWNFSIAEVPALARSQGFHYVAAGTTIVYGIFPRTAPLRRLKPVARTQTFLIYDVNQFGNSSITLH